MGEPGDFQFAVVKECLLKFGQVAINKGNR